MPLQPSVEQSTADTLNIPQKFAKVSNSGAPGLFCGYFKTFRTAAFPLPPKKNNISRIVFLMY